ncbi:MAG: hypothetical protein LBU14_05845 [Candidatus Peribacteria bacterium]|jgi:predicted RNA-binding protein Jag|nr:hypothetical protein [Candidatus Peribacteria bacterium]
MIEIIKNISQEFFEKLGIKIDSLGVINEEENIFLVKLQTKDSSLVIGTNGKNLNNILSIIKLMLKNQIQEPIKVHIEVNDYLQNKDNKLKNYVISKIQIVERTGQDFKMPFFSAYERKKIHSIVGEY